jgi:hypothetical protein
LPLLLNERGVPMRIVPLTVGALFLVSIPLSAQQKLNAEQYRRQLTDLQNREKQLREQIAQEQSAILTVKEQISASEKRISELKQKKLDVVGVTEEHIRTVEVSITDLTDFIHRQNALSDRQIHDDTAAIEKMRQQFGRIEADPAIRLPAVREKFVLLKGAYTTYFQRLEEIDSRPVEEPEAQTAAMEAEKADDQTVTRYTVRRTDGKPESLFSIAERVYGNPNLWPIIYRANKAAIDKNFGRFNPTSSENTYKNPSDLIFPGQVLVIPR